MAASHRLSSRTALTVEQEDGATVVYLSQLTTGRIVVAPSPGAEIILGALARGPVPDHPQAATYLTQLTDEGLLASNDEEKVGGPSEARRVVISAPPSSPWSAAPLPARWRVLPRPLESGARAAIAGRRVHTVWELVRRSKHLDVVILSSAGHEMLLLAVFKPLIACPVVVHDPILPNGRAARGLLGLFTATFDAVWCVRPADLPRWHRAGRATFIPFFAHGSGPSVLVPRYVAEIELVLAESHCRRGRAWRRNVETA